MYFSSLVYLGTLAIEKKGEKKHLGWTTRIAFFSPQEKLIRIYLLDTTRYKYYCVAGKDYEIVLPDQCPFCGGPSCYCLIGHGWYQRKGIIGDEYGYYPFWIRRFLCKNACRTISFLPVFVHTYKRYALSFVMDCLREIIELRKPIKAEARAKGICVRTLKRWLRSFKAQEEAKHSCLLAGRQIPTVQTFAQALLSHFRTALGRGDLVAGSIEAMVTLWRSLTHALY